MTPRKRKKTTARARPAGAGPTRRKKTNQDLTARARKLRDSGLSYRQIGEALIEGGFKPPRAKAWNRVVIGRMLKRAA